MHDKELISSSGTNSQGRQCAQQHCHVQQCYCDLDLTRHSTSPSHVSGRGVAAETLCRCIGSQLGGWLHCCRWQVCRHCQAGRRRCISSGSARIVDNSGKPACRLPMQQHQLLLAVNSLSTDPGMYKPHSRMHTLVLLLVQALI